MAKTKPAPDPLISAGAGLAIGFALVGLVLHLRPNAIADPSFFASLEDFGVLLTAFVTAATVIFLAIEIREGNRTRVDTRIAEHTELAREIASSFRYWSGPTYIDGGRTEALAITRTGFKGFRRALQLRKETAFGNGLVRRHGLHCRQSDLREIADVFERVRLDLQQSVALLDRSRFLFFQEIIDIGDASDLLKNRDAEYREQLEATKHLAEELYNDETASAYLLDLVDAGYLIAVNRDPTTAAILNMSIFPWETVDGALPMTKEPEMTPIEFLSHAREQVANMRQRIFLPS